MQEEKELANQLALLLSAILAGDVTAIASTLGATILPTTLVYLKYRSLVRRKISEGDNNE